MKKLTKSEAVRLHRHMWNWIADETERTGVFFNKYDYFEAMGIIYEDRPKSNCYCCEYAIQQCETQYGDECQYCPLDWKSECNEHMCSYKKELGNGKGLFMRWKNAESVEEGIELARKIANLKAR